MNRSFSETLRLGVAGVAIVAAWELSASVAWAQTPPPPPPEAPAAAPTSPLTSPSFAGPLVQNPTPINADLAGLGTVYLTGVVSGLGLFQSNAVGNVFTPSGKPLGHDLNNNVDLSNGQAIIQKIDGLVQFYALLMALGVGGFFLAILLR